MVAPLAPDDPTSLGAFRLTGRLGEGGQGVVYLGHDAAGEPVAVKVIKTGLDPAVRTRLARELDAMRSVAPFCTARVLTAEVDRSEPYIVSEYVDGPSLQQRVSDGGPLRGGELERLAVGTATALTAIHAAGIVHRDFKPGNVLLGPDGPRVVDFGIARQGESDTITAGPIGTPAYLAPEQIAGSPASAASDVFAWGATVVFAATGHRAFGGDSVAAVLHKIMTIDPDVTGVPAPLRATVGRCLAKDPASRPTARDLLLGLVGSAPDPLVAGVAAADGSVRGEPDVDRTRPRQPVGQPVAHLANVPDAMPAGPRDGAGVSEPLGTEPSGGRRGRRIGLIAAVAALVVAVSVAAAFLLPRLFTTSDPGGSPGSTTPAGAQGTPAATTTQDPTTPGDDPTDSGYGTDPAEEPDDGGTGATVPAAFAGTWRGHITPTPAGLTGEYDVEIELEAGEDKGTWKEPANSCEGTLSLTEAADSVLTFDLVDAGQCVPGTVRLERKGGALTYRWNDALGALEYNGDLAKAG
ncbi:serine/threonine-protein kinase [Planotetraspora kaengkrachanensis]|uniref:Protein kinase domain-containing protein n=1 Tax=Planotetraspora kaengkrachanensis TaxID=575193 RepID=A0A8J3M8M3_9ACTN|nr:serine/threonine-protein kinase [Planotetraspora kaengkrachanensis]GIG79860.1 hypothetical protein Pka01_29870 [Planotetraspora kaengkrachanensis]